jgi:hypothetical protein
VAGIGAQREIVDDDQQKRKNAIERKRHTDIFLFELASQVALRNWADQYAILLKAPRKRPTLTNVVLPVPPSPTGGDHRSIEGKGGAARRERVTSESRRKEQNIDQRRQASQSVKTRCWGGMRTEDEFERSNLFCSRHDIWRMWREDKGGTSQEEKCEDLLKPSYVFAYVWLE